jgi:hypothetical protein
VGDFDAVGGWFAVVSGVALVGVLISAALMPRPLQASAEGDEYWATLTAHPTAHLSVHWTHAVYGLAALAVIPALYELGAAESRPWAWYAGALGFLGLAVTARGHLLEVAWDRHVIRRYPDADDAYRRGVHVVAGYALDVPDGFLTHGATGAWILISSVLILQGDALPAGLAWLGIGAAFFAMVTIAGYVSVVGDRPWAQPLLTTGIVIGTVSEAAWFIWLGIELLN